METAFDREPNPKLVSESLAGSAFGSMWLDTKRQTRPRLKGHQDCDLLIIGAGYTGLWSALHAKRLDPGARVILIDAVRVGWAASGRNGGFVDASLTHGRDNGERRWPAEIDRLDELGMENLNGMQDEIAELSLDAEWERTGMLTVATEPHQVEWLREAAISGPGRLLSLEEVRQEVDSPTYLAGLFEKDSCAIVNPAKLAFELARACEELGVQIFEHTKANSLDNDAEYANVVTGGGSIRARKVVLATNVFPSLLKRNRLNTVPVYDYVLATEPLTDAQLASIGWQQRQGVGDSANQFHYYRLSADNRIVWGGYDAIYHYGGKVLPEYEDRAESYNKLAAHFFTTFPQLEGVRFTHRWAGAIDTSTRFCAHWGLARGGKVAYVNGFTGLGVAASRFAADVCLDLLSGEKTERTELQMVRQIPIPFPPEPIASAGIQATRWSLDQADRSGGRRNVLLKTLDALGLGFDS
ncbi:NAD(P)/FAD-dependent oxidoreductase [Humidisolicoccus flavus]|uniref:NAD(P)/FAD-dependent oxidoreductase n=1 Tax=Humidisolicoccus flavus TaxID=3111414 RepID=UPI0032465D1E